MVVVNVSNFVYGVVDIFSRKKLWLIDLNAEKIYYDFSQIWELCMHLDYDHFIPLTSK